MGNLDFSANADQLQELLSYIASQINVPTIGIGGGYAPIGSINFFDATVAPQDWLACDGTVYNIADYPQLAEWYATQHGASNFYGGNGTTTFAVPDLQGEFLRGTGTNSHTNQGSGAAVGEHQDGTLHVECLSYSSGMAIAERTSDTKHDSEPISIPYRNILGASEAISGSNNYTSRPTNTSFLICVKAVVAGEVYSTEERVVGTWIDGKPVYQRICDMGSLKTVSSTTWYDTGIAYGDADIVVKAWGLSGGGSSSTSNSACPILAYAESTSPNFMIMVSRDDSSLGIRYFTIQYTKTTDG